VDVWLASRYVGRTVCASDDAVMTYSLMRESSSNNRAAEPDCHDRPIHVRNHLPAVADRKNRYSVTQFQG